MTYRRASLADLFGDFVVYRSLRPQDPRLPGFPELREELGIGEQLPRKGGDDYARVVVRVLEEAQRLRGAELSRLVYLGDTHHNDGRTIAALSQYLPVRGFIATEARDPPRVEVDRGVMYSNRWSFLARFLDWLEDGFPLRGDTAVLVDLDKTAFGARGRNSHPLDAARIAAAERLAEAALGERFDKEAFRTAYQEINSPSYHAFTADNQDLVVFSALVAACGAFPFHRLREWVESGRLKSFEQFLVACRSSPLPPGLSSLRKEVETAMARGDPTPFKAFRRLEYLETVVRMDHLPDDTPLELILREEIVITTEVWEFAEQAKRCGCLLFGLTDKPDEASLPLPAQGTPPLHRARMKILP